MKKWFAVALVAMMMTGVCFAEGGAELDSMIAEYQELRQQLIASGVDVAALDEGTESAGSMAGDDAPEWVDKYVIDKDGQIVYDENGLHIVFYGFMESDRSFEHGIPDLLIINETGQDIVFYSDEQYINSIEVSNWNGDVDIANNEYLYLKNEYNCMFDLADMTGNRLKEITDYEMRFTAKTDTEDWHDREDIFSGSFKVKGNYSIFDIWPELAYLSE